MLDPDRNVEIHAESGGIAVHTMFGDIYQIEHYAPPSKQWQSPPRQALNKTFIGRQDEKKKLIEYLTAGEDVAITGKTMAAMLQGMGGIGKTYLALKVAIELQANFPGGVIRINLGPQVTDELSAQRPLLQLASYAFGGVTPVGQLHPEQVAAWLEEIAPGRLLVVFDDVWHQVPLLFLSRALPASAVRLVTTRYANITQALEGKTITLDRLTLQDGLALLEDRLGQQVEEPQRTKLEELVELLDGHPLALELAAAQINKRKSRTWAIQTVLEDLKKSIEHGTLDDLKLPPGAERDQNLEKSLGLSYERMTIEQRRYFRSLGVFAFDTLITVEGAAAIWGKDDLRMARHALSDLVDLALLIEVEDREDISYRQHDLLRVYAYALLNKSDEINSARWAHAHYYTSLLLGAKDNITNIELDQHMQNILYALEWAAVNTRIKLVAFTTIILVGKRLVRPCPPG